MHKKSIDSNAKKALEELKVEIASELGLTDPFKKIGDKTATDIYKSGRVAELMNKKSIYSDDDFMIGG